MGKGERYASKNFLYQYDQRNNGMDFAMAISYPFHIILAGLPIGIHMKHCKDI